MQISPAEQQELAAGTHSIVVTCTPWAARNKLTFCRHSLLGTTFIKVLKYLLYKAHSSWMSDHEKIVSVLVSGTARQSFLLCRAVKNWRTNSPFGPVTLPIIFEMNPWLLLHVALTSGSSRQGRGLFFDSSEEMHQVLSHGVNMGFP